ncbi:MAG TPA: hypothetical protein VLJ13_00770, partial [Brevundimonas sp.]|nr:hypothetical protein [Brevundimonas sp.]
MVGQSDRLPMMIATGVDRGGDSIAMAVRPFRGKRRDTGLALRPQPSALRCCYAGPAESPARGAFSPVSPAAVTDPSEEIERLRAEIDALRR